MFGWALLRLWGALRASEFTGPEPTDPAAAGERVRRLGTLPAEELLRAIGRDSRPGPGQLCADLVALAAGAGTDWHDAETAEAMGEVLAAAGMALAASGEGREGRDVRAAGERTVIEAHVLRGIAADRARDGEEAHRQFSRADHRGSAVGNPVAVALGRIGMLATAETAPEAESLRDSLDRALELLELLAVQRPGAAVEEVRRATGVRVSAREAAHRWWEAGEPVPARDPLERWLSEHRGGDAEELFGALLHGLARSVAVEDGRVADRARLLDAVFAARPRFAVSASTWPTWCGPSRPTRRCGAASRTSAPRCTHCSPATGSTATAARRRRSRSPSGCAPAPCSTP
ncbi:hypothetical protein ACFXKW_05310 [Streptomyces sp. NPDC059193]|uniref:hypothetical protein n=1 Tax=Streptomyces sp. NPDC059193 TaxID=3346763 RepID=UPI0036B75157